MVKAPTQSSLGGTVAKPGGGIAPPTGGYACLNSKHALTGYIVLRRLRYRTYGSRRSDEAGRAVAGSPKPLAWKARCTLF